MYITPSEEASKLDMILEEEEQTPSEMFNYLNCIPRLNICENIDIFLDQKMLYISLSPILPINKIDILLKLYNLKITKDELLKRILKLTNKDNFLKSKKSYENIKIESPPNSNQIKITDEHFIKDCIILSKASREGAFIIADRISKAIFKETITYKYEISDENEKKFAIAYLKFKDNIYIESDLSENDIEAKLNVCKKIIIKYLPRKPSREIINNINECIVKEEKSKSEKKERYEKFLLEAGGDRELLRNKRRMTQEEFSRRLPYFNMLNKNKIKKGKGNEFDINENDDGIEEIYFMNTDNLPINEILLGDLGIVDNHLKDFKYTPFKMFEMIRDSEKKRGVDLKMEYTQINNKNYCINCEATIFSQKLGLKVNGYGKTKEEAGNKCALNMLSILFRNKFKTYFELHDYFKNKNKKYLDIILIDEDTQDKEIKNKDNKDNKEKDINKKEENIYNILTGNQNENGDNKNQKKEEKNNIIINNNLKNIIKNNNNENIEMVESMPIYFNSDNLSFENVLDNNSYIYTDTHESSDTINCDINNMSSININNININKNNNIGNNFGKLFNCNSYNNDVINQKNNNNKNISNTKRSRKKIRSPKNFKVKREK